MRTRTARASGNESSFTGRCTKSSKTLHKFRDNLGKGLDIPYGILPLIQCEHSTDSGSRVKFRPEYLPRVWRFVSAFFIS